MVRRVQQTALGAGCIVGGCALMAWLVHGLLAGGILFSPWESRAWGAEPTPSSTSSAIPLEAEDSGADDSFEPRARVIIPPGRPEWVEADFTDAGGEVERLAVSSGPYKGRHEATEALEEELKKATRNYVAEFLGNETAATLVPVDIGYIRQELIPAGHTYTEQIEVSVGKMYQSHALLEFTPRFQQHLRERWQRIVVTSRVLKLGVISVGVLMVLGVVFGYFKADTATRGYYSTRLQLGSATAILALVAGALLLFRHL